MLVTLLGIIMFERLVHPLNVLPPMFITLFGIFTSVILEQPENAELFIDFKPSGIIIFVTFLQL